MSVRMTIDIRDRCISAMFLSAKVLRGPAARRGKNESAAAFSKAAALLKQSRFALGEKFT